MEKDSYKGLCSIIHEKIEIIHDKITLTDEVEIVYEKRVTPFGTSARVDAPKRYIGRRAYVVILKE